MPILSSSAVNNVQVDGVYVYNQPPAPTAGAGVATSLSGLVGTGAWGALNSPTAFSDMASCYLNFGKTSGPYSLSVESFHATALSNNFLGVRVADGSQLAASLAIKDNGGSVTGGTLTAKNTGHEGNNITVTLAAGSNSTGTPPSTITVTVTRQGYQPEVYPNLANNGTGGFWAILVNAINNGLSGVRPASNLVVATVGTSVLPATTNTPNGVNLAGGSNGEFGSQITIASPVAADVVNVTVNGTQVSFTVPSTPTASGVATSVASAINANSTVNAVVKAVASGAVITLSAIQTPNASYTLSTSITGAGGTTATVTQAVGAGLSAAGSNPQIGTDGTTGRTGMYSLRGTGIAQFILCGNTDSTVYATQNTFAASEGSLAIKALPSGTSTTSALSTKQTANANSIYGALCKDWVNYYDPVLTQQRLVSPLGCHLGLIASLPPEASPGNKPSYGFSTILSTERTGTPYSYAEAAQLAQAGVLYITNPIPRGNLYGEAHGENESAIAGQDTIAYTRMTNFLSASLASMLGPFIGELQSTSPQDLTRAAAKAAIANFLMELQRKNRISGFNVQLNTANNTPTSIGQGYLLATVQVQYMAVVRYFLVSLMGGQTVQIATSGTVQ